MELWSLLIGPAAASIGFLIGYCIGKARARKVFSPRSQEPSERDGWRNLLESEVWQVGDRARNVTAPKDSEEYHWRIIDHSFDRVPVTDRRKSHWTQYQTRRPVSAATPSA